MEDVDSGGKVVHRSSTSATSLSASEKVNDATLSSSQISLNNYDDENSNQVMLKTGVGRRRSLSVSTAQPSVETVIVKAKRAASHLWMLLHAQVRNGIHVML